MKNFWRLSLSAICLITFSALMFAGCQSGSDDDSDSLTGPKAAASGAGLVIDDPLQGSTVGELAGGSFTEEGYSPGAGTKHILYRVSREVSSGYIEVEVKGMNPGKIPSGGDHGFLVMYDGRNIGEPITMFDNFKQNYYRWNIHWRKNSNAMKCVITTARPDRDRSATHTPVFPTVSGHDHHRDWSAEPMGTGFNWNPDRWHMLKVQWNGGAFRVFIDEQQVWQANGPYAYAPVDFRIWLGSGPGKYSSDMSGHVFRNFRLYAD